MKKLLAVLAATSALAGAAQAQEIKEFNLGILGGENAQDRLTSNECYRAKLEAALGVPVKVFTPADYDGVIQGLLGGTLDMAWLGASGFSKIYLTDPNAVELKLTKQNADGSTGYYSIGFARKDSGITKDRRRQGQGLRLRRTELDLGLSGSGRRADRDVRPAGPVLLGSEVLGRP